MKVCITLWSLYIFQRGGLKPQFPKGLNYLMPVKRKYYQTWTTSYPLVLRLQVLSCVKGAQTLEVRIYGATFTAVEETTFTVLLCIVFKEYCTGPADDPIF